MVHLRAIGLSRPSSTTSVCRFHRMEAKERKIRCLVKYQDYVFYFHNTGSGGDEELHISTAFAQLHRIAKIILLETLPPTKEEIHYRTTDQSQLFCYSPVARSAELSAYDSETHNCSLLLTDYSPHRAHYCSPYWGGPFPAAVQRWDNPWQVGPSP
uniref:PHM7_ext domain-containing protein n=1 Tax=Heterorhabditis bacteriophora TaxID=37862 RepID=A0A1I7X691_HETBA